MTETAKEVNVSFPNQTLGETLKIIAGNNFVVFPKEM